MKLFSKERHYTWACTLLVCAVVLGVRYGVNDLEAQNQLFAAFTESVASIVPAVRLVLETHMARGAMWALLFAAAWAAMPVVFVFGVAGTFFLDESQYEKLIAKCGFARLLMIFLIGLACVTFVFELPLVSSFLINQMSAFLPKLLFSWLVVCVCVYALGRSIGAIAIKLSNVRREHIHES